MTGIAKKLSPLIFFLLLSCSAAQLTETRVDLIIDGVSVIDLYTGKIEAGQSIIIDGGEVKAVVPRHRSGEYTASQRENHSGEYAMPALWDMHVHFRGGEALVEANAQLLAFYPGNGIATVRDAGGDIPQAVLTWRDEISAGTRIGPRIFTPLQKLDGADGFWPGSIPVVVVEDVVPAMDTLEAGGADFIKLYESKLSADMYLALLKEAEMRGLKTTGHMPFDAPFSDAIDAGLDGIEHMGYLVKGAAADERGVLSQMEAAARAGSPMSFTESRPLMMASFDADHAMAQFREMARRGTTVTPTLHIATVLDFLTENDHEGESLLLEVPPAIRETYRMRIDGAARRSAKLIEVLQARHALERRMIAMLRDAGVTILAGSDAGPFNSYVYPGDSLHSEMALLVEVGLSPLEALQAATTAGMKYFGVEAQFDAVARGKTADILLLRSNPLERIENSRSFTGLVQGGAYRSAAEMAALRKL